MNVAKEIVDPLRVVVDVVPSSPTACDEKIGTVEERNGLWKCSAVFIAKVEVALVVPCIELGRKTLLRNGLRVVDEDNRLVALEHTEVLQVPPAVLDLRHCVYRIPSSLLQEMEDTVSVSQHTPPRKQTYMRTNKREYLLREGRV